MPSPGTDTMKKTGTTTEQEGEETGGNHME